jgi:hypothetical protein
LNRDRIFGESKDSKIMVRVPTSENDMVPIVLMESKPVTEIDPLFFLVQLGHGAPKSDEFNILKVYDFPVEN